MEYVRVLARCIPLRPLIAAASLVAAVGVLSADAGKVPFSEVTETRGELTINWTRGLILTSAGAAADLRAPTAEIARIKAERNAFDLARDRLVAAAAELVGKKSLAIADDVLTMEVEYASDGSTRVTAALAIESVRRAVWGPSEPPSAHEPAEFMVDARAAAIKPAIGLSIAAGAERYRGPVQFIAASAGGFAAAKRVVSVEGNGVLTLAEGDAKAVISARAAAAVIVVLVPSK